MTWDYLVYSGNIFHVDGIMHSRSRNTHQATSYHTQDQLGPVQPEMLLNRPLSQPQPHTPCRYHPKTLSLSSMKSIALLPLLSLLTTFLSNRIRDLYQLCQIQALALV